MKKTAIDSLYNRHVEIHGGEVRFVTDTSVFRLYGIKPDRKSAVIHGKCFARALRDVIIADNEKQDTQSSNRKLLDVVCDLVDVLTDCYGNTGEPDVIKSMVHNTLLGLQGTLTKEEQDYVQVNPMLSVCSPLEDNILN